MLQTVDNVLFHKKKMKSILDNIIVVIKPTDEQDQTKSGLYLPAGYKSKEEVQQGYILKCGPGYALPTSEDESESWNGKAHEVRYLPLQVQPGDCALFMQKNAVEIKYHGEKYFIVPQNAILLVEREEF